MRKIFLLFALLLVFTITTPLLAQSIPVIECGQIIEGEILPGPEEEESVFDEYRLQVRAGTTLQLLVEPLGQTFNVGVELLDSGGSRFDLVNDGAAGTPEELLDYVLGSSNPLLRMHGVIPDGVGEEVWGSGRYGQYFGAYEIRLGCTLRDGTMINPGDRAPEPMALEAVFSGFGFAGLDPVDFSNGVTIPLNLDNTNTGSIQPGFEGIFGFSFDATEGETYRTSFSRVSGNLNLGIVILSEDNQVSFQATLISTNYLTADFVAPSTGRHTIGVFNADIASPSNPENTTFMVEISQDS